MPILTSGSRLIRHKATSSNSLLSNLIGYWGLDEAGGANNALDKHSNGLTLTQVASPGSTTGLVYAGVRTFDGTQYFKRTSETLLQTGDIDFAIAAWVYMTSTPAASAAIVSKRASNTTCDFHLYWNTTGKFTSTLFNPATGTDQIVAEWSATASLNTWYLVLTWHDSVANTLNISVNNGTAVSTATATAAPTASASEFRIGELAQVSRPFYGRIGPVAFWKNRILDATARTTLYNAGVGLAYSSFS